MKTNEMPIKSDGRLEDDCETNVDDSTQSGEREQSTSETKPYLTRYGRIVKTPARYVNRYYAVISIFGLLTFQNVHCVCSLICFIA